MNQWRKGIAEWKCGDTLYLSVPFTWLLGEAEAKARAHKGKVVAGGPAVKLMGAPWAGEAPDDCGFDALTFHNPCATFTTRGCPNRCAFCAVPKIEGDFRELETWKAAPMICDNNILASTKRHFADVVESSRQFPCVDFNQGLDARLFTAWHADLLRSLPNVITRFAFDHIRVEGKVSDAIATARTAGLRDIRVFVLLGFRDTPEDARHRLDKVCEWGCLPCPQRYQPLDALEKNAYVAPGWTEYELRKIVRYYYKRRFWLDVSYEDFRPEPDSLFAGSCADNCGPSGRKGK